MHFEILSNGTAIQFSVMCLSFTYAALLLAFPIGIFVSIPALMLAAFKLGSRDRN